jgi:FkbM family methyltransferase
MGHKMLIRAEELFLKNVLYSRQYHDDNIHLIHHFVKKDSIVLDIGANIGLYCCGYAQRYKKLNLKIYAIEALKNNFNFLQENIRLNNFHNIKPFLLAIGKDEGLLQITIPNKEFVGNVAGDNIKGLEDTGYKYQVKMLTLDDWALKEQITHCDFIKIDIEGAEYFAFLGGQNFIKRTRPVIQAEFNRYWCEKAGISLKMLATFFTDLQYDIAIENKNHFRFISVQNLEHIQENLVDLLFVPMEKIPERKPDFKAKPKA